MEKESTVESVELRSSASGSSGDQKSTSSEPRMGVRGVGGSQAPGDLLLAHPGLPQVEPEADQLRWWQVAEEQSQ